MGTYEWETCPHCGKRVSDVRRGIASDTTIGQDVATCPYCGGLFKTGKSEWHEKTTLQKIGYYIRVFWWCLGAFVFGGGGTVLVVLFVFVLSGKSKTTPMESMLSLALPIGIIVAVLLVIIIILSAKREIANSIKQTK